MVLGWGSECILCACLFFSITTHATVRFECVCSPSFHFLLQTVSPHYAEVKPWTSVRTRFHWKGIPETKKTVCMLKVRCFTFYLWPHGESHMLVTSYKSDSKMFAEEKFCSHFVKVWHYYFDISAVKEWVVLLSWASFFYVHKETIWFSFFLFFNRCWERFAETVWSVRQMEDKHLKVRLLWSRC